MKLAFKRERKDVRRYLLQISVHSDQLDSPVFGDAVPMATYWAVESVALELHRVLFSKRSVLLNRSFRIHATTIDVGPAEIGAQKILSLGFWTRSVLKSVLPAFSLQEHGLTDCCLLVALVMGMSHCDYLSMSSNRGGANKKRKARSTFSLFRRASHDAVHGRRVSDDASALMAERVNALCLDLNASLEDFRNCSFDDSLRLKFKTFPYNVNIFQISGGGVRRIWQHPLKFDRRKPTLDLLLVQGEDDKKYHCALIPRLRVFCEQRGRMLCYFCGKYYALSHFNTHRCSGYKSCVACRKRILLKTDHQDSLILRRCCTEESKVKCDKCDRVCRGPECLKQHRKECEILETCSKCLRTYRALKEPHECGKTYFCRPCAVRYRPDESHVCTMARPKAQKFLSRLVVWDTETTVDETTMEHRVNAVGASFEDGDYGQFSYVSFYDSDMDHDEDGVVDKHCFQFDYFPDGFRPKFPNPPDVVVRLFSGELSPKRKRRKTTSDSVPFVDDVAEECDGSDSSDEQGKDQQDFFSACRDAGQGSFGDLPDPAPPGSALVKFLDFFLGSPDFCHYTFVAHASAKFDSPLILRALLRRYLDVEPILDGNKMLLLKLPRFHISFVDSYRYVNIPLAKFPSRFPDVARDGGKGSFPFAFNKPENYSHDGEVPEEKFYVDEFSSVAQIEKTREYLREWPQERRWSFKKELARYLRQDVSLLRAGVVALVKEFMTFQEELKPMREEGEDETRVFFHPFSPPFFTGSSFVHAVWRFYAMPSNTIYLVENQKNARKTSRGEQEWLLYVGEKRFIKSTFTTGGQHKVGPYYLDGYDESANMAYEFNGCLVHGHVAQYRGCPMSLSLELTDPNLYGLALKSAYERWLKKKHYLESKGLHVRVMWECEFERLKTDDTSLASSVSRLQAELGLPRERLRIRTALRGGRTEVFRLMYNAPDSGGEEEMCYLDKNSLYPHIAVQHCFPAGKPTSYVGESLRQIRVGKKGVFRKADGRELHGLIQCVVLPPDSLFFPVLPSFVRKKLMYGLCRSCLEAGKNILCSHSDLDRQMEDTWTTVELVYALKCGYRLIKVHELFLYEEMKPLFRDFYLQLARMKLEAEGFPVTAQSEEEKREHVRRLNANMPGLDLCRERVSRNESRRNFAKFVSYFPFSPVVVRCRVLFFCRCLMPVWESSLKMTPKILRCLSEAGSILQKFSTIHGRCSDGLSL